MPIQGLTDRGKGFLPLGFVRFGTPKQVTRDAEGRKHTVMGKDLKTLMRVEIEDVDVRECFRALYGLTPERAAVIYGKAVALPTDYVLTEAILAFLPFQEIKQNWEAWIERYDGRGVLLHRCDGEFVNLARDPKTGRVTVARWIDQATGKRVACPDKDKAPQAHGKAKGRLKIIVPGLGRLAHLMVMIGSKNAVGLISDQLAGIADPYGTVANVPLILRRMKFNIPTPDETYGTVMREKWLLTAEVLPEFAQRTISVLPDVVMAALAARTHVAGALPAPAQVITPAMIEYGPEDEEEDGIDAGDIPIDAEAIPEQAQEAPSATVPEPAPEANTQQPDQVWPATKAEFESWAKQNGYSGQEVRDVFGKQPSLLVDRKEYTWAGIAQAVAAQLPPKTPKS